MGAGIACAAPSCTRCPSSHRAVVQRAAHEGKALASAVAALRRLHQREADAAILVDLKPRELATPLPGRPAGPPCMHLNLFEKGLKSACQAPEGGCGVRNGGLIPDSRSLLST